MSRGSVGHVPQPCFDGGEPSAAVATIVFHGDCDSTVHPSNGMAIHEQSSRSYCGEASRQKRRGSSATRTVGGRKVTRFVQVLGDGRPLSEFWLVHGAGHAWVGGDAQGSFADTDGPDASREMARFFLQHRLSASAQRSA